MQLGGRLGSRFETPVRAWKPWVSKRDPSPLAHERKSTIRSRIYFAGLPLSHSRDESY